MCTGACYIEHTSPHLQYNRIDVYKIRFGSYLSAHTFIAQIHLNLLIFDMKESRKISLSSMSAILDDVTVKYS